MTSPITPESRAKALLDKFERECTDDMSYPQWFFELASALRDAENAAYERAADRVKLLAGDHIAEWILNEIRSLKTKET